MMISIQPLHQQVSRLDKQHNGELTGTLRGNVAAMMRQAQRQHRPLLKP